MYCNNVIKNADYNPEIWRITNIMNSGLRRVHA